MSINIQSKKGRTLNLSETLKETFIYAEHVRCRDQAWDIFPVTVKLVSCEDRLWRASTGTGLDCINWSPQSEWIYYFWTVYAYFYDSLFCRVETLLLHVIVTSCHWTPRYSVIHSVSPNRELLATVCPQLCTIHDAHVLLLSSFEVKITTRIRMTRIDSIARMETLRAGACVRRVSSHSP